MDTPKKSPDTPDTSKNTNDAEFRGTVIPSVGSAPLRDKIAAEQDSFAGDRLIKQTAEQMQTGSSNSAMTDVVNNSIDTSVSKLGLSITSAIDNAGGGAVQVGNGATIDDVRPTLRGEGEPLTRIQLFSDGKHVGNVVVDQLGYWQITVSNIYALEPGEHVFTVVDAAGNVSEPFTLIVDIPESSRPVIDVVVDNAGVPVDIANGGTTDDSTPTIQGRGEPGNQVFLYDEDRLIGSAFVGPDGRYSIEPGSRLAPGEYNLRVFMNGIPSHLFTLNVTDETEPSKPMIDSAFDDHGMVGEIAIGGTTDDTTPTLHGKGESGSQIRVFDNNSFIGYVDVDSAGNWTFIVPPRVPGEHVFTVENTTSAGIVTSDPFTLNIDAPDSAKPVIESAFDNFGVIGDVANGGTTDDKTPTLSGKGEPGTQIKIYDNGRHIGYAMVQPDGNWMFPIPQSLMPGEHVFTVVNAGVSSDPFTVNVGAPDSAKPVIESAFDNFGVIGDVANGGTTDDRTPTLSGKGEPGTQIKIYDNGRHIGYAMVQPDGNWIFPIPQSLMPGEHVFTVVNAGVSSDPFTVNVGAPDSAKPVIESAFDNFGVIGDVANGGTTDDKTPTLSGKGEPGTQIKIYDNGRHIGYAMVQPDGNWIFPIPQSLMPGEHVFTVVNAGVSSDPFTVNVGAPDSAKPVIESAFDNFGVIGDVANGGTTDDKTPTLSGKGEPGTQIKIYDNGRHIGYAMVQPDGNWIFPIPQSLMPGEHVFTVVNAGVSSDPFTVNVGAPDSAKPVIESAFDNFGVIGDVANGGTTDDKTPTLSGKGEPGTQIKIYDNGRHIGYAMVQPDGNWIFPIPQSLMPGEHVFTVVNAGVSSDPFTVNVGAPDSAKPVIESAFDNFGVIGDVANGGTTDDTKPLLSGQGEPFTQLKVYDKGNFLGYANVDHMGKWIFNVVYPLGKGEHVFTVEGAGVNSDPFTLTISEPDSVKPVVDTVIDNIGDTSVIVSGGTTDDARPTFSGHGEPSTILFVYDKGEPIGSVEVGADGSWSFTNHAKRLGEGEHVFTFVGAGVTSDPFVLNVENVPESRALTIDSAFDSEGLETGTVESGATIDDQLPMFSGRGEPNALLWIYDNYQLVDQVIVDAQGNWTFEPEKLNILDPGEHIYMVLSDGVYSEPFVLNVVEAGAMVGGEEVEVLTSDDLPLMSELLQPTDELFAGEADISPVGEGGLELSADEFDASLNHGGSPVETNGSIVVAVPPVESVELWQQQPYTL